MNSLKLSISPGNRKMGAIPSVSLPACTTCNPIAPCFKGCYAVKIAKIYKSAAVSYEHNLDILTIDPNSYWLQVEAAAMVTKYFRYHVSGDMPNMEYFKKMIALANKLSDTQFLAFTKQYNIVNDYLNDGGQIPHNLKLIFSNWGSWKCNNPYNLPECEVIFKGDKPADQWKICGGNCTECACRGVGCWELKKGETIAIYKH